MANSVLDMLILQRLRVLGKAAQVPHIIPMYWLALSPSWIKVNKDGTDNGAPSLRGCGGILGLLVVLSIVVL